MQDNSDLIIRDCCEAEVAEFGQPDTICITVDVLREIVQRHSPGTCLHQITEPQAAPAAVAVPDERSAFESWWSTPHLWSNGHKEAQWSAWQARAALAATTAAAPAGWKLVPVEPTAEMLERAGATDRDGTPATYKTLYMAMVGVAPAADAPKAIAVPAELLERVIDSLSSFAGNKPHTEADMTTWEQLNNLLSAEPAAAPAQTIERERMTAGRASYFMERFLKEEKLLGPNEQAALHFVIDMLEAAAAAPVVRPEPDAVINEVMELVKDWAQRDLIAVEAGIDTLTEESSEKQHQEAKRLDGEAETAYRAIEAKLRALLAGVSAPPAEGSVIRWVSNGLIGARPTTHDLREAIAAAEDCQRCDCADCIKALTLPLKLVEAINTAVGGNEWQGDALVTDLLEPACKVIADLTPRAQADKKARMKIAAALGHEGVNFAWSYLTGAIKELVKAERELVQLKSLAQADARDAVLAHLDGLLDDAAAHIYPSDLNKFQTGEHTATVASVRMGNRSERSVPLYSREQVVEAFDAAQAAAQSKG